MDDSERKKLIAACQALLDVVGKAPGLLSASNIAANPYEGRQQANPGMPMSGSNVLPSLAIKPDNSRNWWPELDERKVRQIVREELSELKARKPKGK